MFVNAWLINFSCNKFLCDVLPLCFLLNAPPAEVSFNINFVSTNLPGAFAQNPGVQSPTFFWRSLTSQSKAPNLNFQVTPIVIVARFLGDNQSGLLDSC